MPTRVRVVVPASTANLGPGFDCLGLALGLYNTFEVTLLPEGADTRFDISGEGAGKLPTDSSNLFAQATRSLWEAAEHSPPGLHVISSNGIPVGSGLGSSSAAVVGGLVAGNALFGSELSRDELLVRAFEIEGHPDNLAAAIYGGLVLVAIDGKALHSTSIDVSSMKVVIALPAVTLATVEARKVLPLSVPHADAVFNISHAAFVVQALQRGDYSLLSWAMQDRLHQPYRRELIYGFDAAEQAARENGAVAVTLSGAGPGLAAFAEQGHEEIAAAMSEAFADKGMPCRTFVLPVDRQGVQVSVLS